MKKILNKILIFALALTVTNCSDPDNAIYDVFDVITISIKKYM